jgi:hypothetical protein
MLPEIAPIFAGKYGLGLAQFPARKPQFLASISLPAALLRGHGQPVSTEYGADQWNSPTHS